MGVQFGQIILPNMQRIKNRSERILKSLEHMNVKFAARRFQGIKAIVELVIITTKSSAKFLKNNPDYQR